jgi:hypothetical protein
VLLDGLESALARGPRSASAMDVVDVVVGASDGGWDRRARDFDDNCVR